MSKLFKKMNLKPEVDEIVVLNAPESFEPELADLSGVNIVRDAAECDRLTFALAFVKTQAGLDAAAELLTTRAQGDALLWFAYPKRSSKKYTCEFDRDSGWEALGRAGFEPVRQVAIDSDWSALRFRRVEYIKSLKRKKLKPISAAGKRRAQESDS